jgi:hypothetical protein
LVALRTSSSAIYIQDLTTTRRDRVSVSLVTWERSLHSEVLG